MGKAITAMDKSGSFRVCLSITTDVVEKAREIHETTPLATAALGRVLTGAGLMGLLMKNDSDKVTVQFKGDGPAKQILATADGCGNVKGYIAVPDVNLPLREDGHLDVGGSLGIGDLTVIRDMGLKEPYVGRIALVSGEIADDLTAYYYISEQQNTSVALGVKIARNQSVLCAGGMIIQMLPEAKEEAVDALETLLKDMPPLTTLIEETVLKSAGYSEEGTVELLLKRIFENIDPAFMPEKTDTREINWKCDCSEERLEGVLATLGADELQAMIDEDNGAEMVCQFCEKKYYFDAGHLQRILDAVKGKGEL